MPSRSANPLPASWVDLSVWADNIAKTPHPRGFLRRSGVPKNGQPGGVRSGAGLAALLDQSVTALDLGMAEIHDLSADIHHQFT